jgi:hypothetical protein
MEGLRQPLLMSGRGELRNFAGFDPSSYPGSSQRDEGPPASQAAEPTADARKKEGECRLYLAAVARPPLARPQTRVTEVGQVGRNGYDPSLYGKKVPLVLKGKSHKLRHGRRHSG